MEKFDHWNGYACELRRNIERHELILKQQKQKENAQSLRLGQNDQTTQQCLRFEP